MSKVVIVSGGSFGIGEAAVKKFIALNHRVYNLDIHTPEFSHPNSTFISCNVSSVSQIQNAVHEVLQKEKNIDVIIANAGKHYSGNIEETEESHFDEMINLNIKGIFFLLRAALPTMRQQKSGSIVILGSDQSFIGKANSAVYGLTKAAVAQLAKSTAIDYGPFNIRVNAVCPGTIDTPLYQSVIKKYSKNSGIPLTEIEKTLASQQLLNRIGKPEEVAELMYFLSSDQAQFITGSLFSIDGGYTAI